MQGKVSRIDWLKCALSELSDDYARPWNEYPCFTWPFGKSMKVRHDAGLDSVGVRGLAFTVSGRALNEGERVFLFCGNHRCFRPSHLYGSLYPVSRGGKQTKVEWLRATLASLDDDMSRLWSDYPCLEWPFSCAKVGYGQLSFEGNQTTVHRLSLTLSLRRSLGELDACHHCDNPPCFRPIHLFAGTAKDNSQDMARKGRSGPRAEHVNVGADHFNSRMNDELVYQARLDLLAGKSRKDISAMLDICQSGTDKLLRGDTWKHVPMPT